MGQSFSPHIFLILLFGIFAFLYLFSGHSNQNTKMLTTEEIIPSKRLSDSLPIIFYHNAYVDHRYSPPRLRIFALSSCIDKGSYLLVDILRKGSEIPERIKVYGESLEGSCPSTYSPRKPCFYNPHTFSANLASTDRINQVRIDMGSRKIRLSVKEINKRYEKGITVCLQPVYYYTQWQNIVLYIEAWRAQGATRFIVFYHSSTKETRQVLDYYQSLGIIELRSWPSFGSLPAAIAKKYPKVDDSSFIFEYFLAMNICILDIKTTIGTVADFDEVIVHRDGSLIDYATEEMTGTSVGALLFENHYVSMQPSIYTSNFSGVASPVFVDRNGPTKYIFNTSVIEIAQVHRVKSFIDPAMETKEANGALLHFRFMIDGEKKSEKPFRFFPNNEFQHIKNMQDTASKIFNGSIPMFSSNLIEGVYKCVDKIRGKGSTCRSTGGLCRKEMDKLAEWVYDTTEGIFVSE